MLASDKPLVSVIIPVYNAEKYIEETIVSVLNQTYQNFEIIIVDDGSTDHSASVVFPLSERDNRIRYIYQKNAGVSVARNTGYIQAEGKFIAFLDADDIWLSCNLEKKLDKIYSGDFGLVHSSASLINEKTEAIEGVMEGLEGSLLNDFLQWQFCCVPGPSSVLLKKEVLEKVGLFDPELSTSADLDIFIRIAAKFTIGKVNEITWKYRVHAQNMHKNIALMEHDILIIYSKAKAADLFHNKVFANLCFAKMYLILGLSWLKDGGNLQRGLYYIAKSMVTKPKVSLVYFKAKFLKKLNELF